MSRKKQTKQKTIVLVTELTTLTLVIVKCINSHKGILYMSKRKIINLKSVMNVESVRI